MTFTFNDVAPDTNIGVLSYIPKHIISFSNRTKIDKALFMYRKNPPKHHYMYFVTWNKRLSLVLFATRPPAVVLRIPTSNEISLSSKARRAPRVLHFVRRSPTAQLF